MPGNGRRVVAFLVRWRTIEDRSHPKSWNRIGDKVVHICPHLVCILVALVALPVTAQESPARSGSPLDPEQQELHDQFRSQLEGAVLVGSFTTLSKEGEQDESELTKERYEIKSAKKAPNGDYWLINARIQYGKRDMLFPVPVKVKWAGKTPVIIVDDVTIPGLGTFGSRVVLHNGKYAGTWRHDDVGGHLFGKIEKQKDLSQ